MSPSYFTVTGALDIGRGTVHMSKGSRDAGAPLPAQPRPVRCQAGPSGQTCMDPLPPPPCPRCLPHTGGATGSQSWALRPEGDDSLHWQLGAQGPSLWIQSPQSRPAGGLRREPRLSNLMSARPVFKTTPSTLQKLVFTELIGSYYVPQMTERSQKLWAERWKNTCALGFRWALALPTLARCLGPGLETCCTEESPPKAQPPHSPTQRPEGEAAGSAPAGPGPGPAAAVPGASRPPNPFLKCTVFRHSVL